MSALRAVDDDFMGDAPHPRHTRTHSVSKAAQSGDRVLLLETLRDRVAKQVQDPNCPPRDLASLSKRLMEICDELDKAKAAAAKDSALGAPVAADEEWSGV